MRQTRVVADSKDISTRLTQGQHHQHSRDKPREPSEANFWKTCRLQKPCPKGHRITGLAGRCAGLFHLSQVLPSALKNKDCSEAIEGQGARVEGHRGALSGPSSLDP